MLAGAPKEKYTLGANEPFHVFKDFNSLFASRV